MPIVSPKTREELDPQGQQVYDDIAASRGGRMPNVFATLLHSPGCR